MTVNETAPPASASPPRTRRRRWWLIALITLVVLVGVIVVVDRVAAAAAENQLEDMVVEAAAEQDLHAKRTSVTIPDLPFLDQVAGGKVSHIDIKMSDATVDNLPLEQVDADLYGVDVPREALLGGSSADVRAEKVVGSVTISPEELAKRLPYAGVRLIAADDRLRASLPVSYAGFSGQVTREVAIRIDGERLWIETTDLSTHGLDAPETVIEYVNGQLTGGYVLPEIPFGLTLTEVKTQTGSIVVSGSATNVPLGR